MAEEITETAEMDKEVTENSKEAAETPKVTITKN
jgi:hypothetical protein